MQMSHLIKKEQNATSFDLARARTHHCFFLSQTPQQWRLTSLGTWTNSFSHSVSAGCTAQHSHAGLFFRSFSLGSTGSRSTKWIWTTIMPPQTSICVVYLHKQTEIKVFWVVTWEIVLLFVITFLFPSFLCFSINHQAGYVYLRQCTLYNCAQENIFHNCVSTLQ